MAADQRRSFGLQGETIAAQHLEAQGFEILKRNFQTRYGEIDIIARDGETLVFVEVRSKKDAVFGHPLETINHRKQGKIIRMARVFLAMEHIADSVPCRFDVVGIVRQGDGFETIHVKNAFTA